METLSRRNFIKGALAIPVGVAVGAGMIPMGRKINTKTTEITNHPTGNAGLAQKVEEACAKEEDPKKCEVDYDLSFSEKFVAVVEAPVIEEFMFRAIPSVAVDEFLGEGDEDGLETVLHGTDYLGVTRNELIVGALSSLAFGLTHNLTNTGIDTQTIPASQTAGGLVLWALQRRLGIASNMTAHATLNLIAVNS